MKTALPLLALTLSSAVAAPAFTAKTVDDKISIGYGLAIGDVDGDKKPDILLADAKEIVWYKNPGWEKSVIAKNLTLRDNVCIAARDLDGDGKVEIAVGAQEQSVSLGEVNVGVNQLDQVAQKNAAMVEQSMLATQSLRQEAVGLDGLVSHFKTSEVPMAASAYAPVKRLRAVGQSY